MLELVPKSGGAVRTPRFQDLRVRPKLIVLHNLFFFVLAGAVYYAVIPLVEEYVANARQREAEILGWQFLERREALPFGELEADEG